MAWNAPLGLEQLCRSRSRNWHVDLSSLEPSGSSRVESGFEEHQHDFQGVGFGYAAV